MEANTSVLTGSPSAQQVLSSGIDGIGGGFAMNDKQPAMTEQEAADRLTLSVKTLRAWRCRRTGPKFVRFGRAVRYMPSAVDDFIRASTVDTCEEWQVQS